MNLGSAYYFLMITFGLVFSLAAKSSDHQSNESISQERQETSSESRSNQGLTTRDLELYLNLLVEREKQLKAANDALLQNANYSMVKIPIFMMKAALDGYLTAQMGGSTKVTEGVVRTSLEKLKTLGFNVGVLGITASLNSAVQPTFRWQYVIPIYGSAYSAYLWSDNLMNSADLIKKNGNELIEIRREKQRVRSLLERSSN